MKQKLKSDNGFFEFIKKDKRTVILLAMVICGVLVLLLSGSSSTKETEEAGMEIAEICSSIEGVGRCKVALTYDEEGEVYAAAVLCEGAEHAEVREKIYDLMTSLYGIRTSRISILKISE